MSGRGGACRGLFLPASMPERKVLNTSVESKPTDIAADFSCSAASASASSPPPTRPPNLNADVLS
jgi:hypothetical protein